MAALIIVAVAVATILNTQNKNDPRSRLKDTDDEATRDLCITSSGDGAVVEAFILHILHSIILAWS